MLRAPTLGELLHLAARTEPEAPAFRYRDEELTYADWDLLAQRMAARLWQEGVGRGDVVALLLPSTPFYLVAYLAAARLGAVTAGINTRYRKSEIVPILQRSRAKLLIAVRRSSAGADFETIVHEARAELPDLAGVVCLEEKDLRRGTRAVVETLAAGARAAPIVEVTEEDPVAIVFTSGTTGVPKGAWYAHRSLMALAEIETRRYAGGELPFRKHLAAGVSFAHLGTMARIAIQIAHRGMSIVHDQFEPEAVLRTIEAERLVHLGAFPTQMVALLDRAERSNYDLSSLKSVLLGGAPVAPELIHRVIRQLGATVSVRYSSTEVGIATTSLPDDPPETLCSTVGKATAGVELRIVDDQNQALPAGEVGEVVVRSGATMRGYWNDPEMTAQVIDSEGWVHTGDLGFLDSEGYLHLRGRRTEMYIRGGFNVYPVEIEHRLQQHPKVAMAAVLGMPDPYYGEIGWAFVVPRDPSDAPTLEELRAFVGEELASFKRPDGLTLLEQMPLTPMFKPDKRALRASFEEHMRREGRREPGQA